MLKNYKREADAANSPYGVGSEDYAKCSWGLLLPDFVQDAFGNGYSEIMFLLNLYSPHFLRPVFSVMSLRRVRSSLSSAGGWILSCGIEIFRTPMDCILSLLEYAVTLPTDGVGVMMVFAGRTEFIEKACQFFVGECF